MQSQCTSLLLRSKQLTTDNMHHGTNAYTPLYPSNTKVLDAINAVAYLSIELINRQMHQNINIYLHYHQIQREGRNTWLFEKSLSQSDEQHITLIHLLTQSDEIVHLRTYQNQSIGLDTKLSRKTNFLFEPSFNNFSSHTTNTSIQRESMPLQFSINQ